MLPLVLAGLGSLMMMSNPRRKSRKRSRRNPPRDPRFAGAFKGDVPKGPIVGVHPLVDGDTAAVEGPRGWESWIFGPEIGPRGYREVWQFMAKHPSEKAAIEHAKEVVWGPIKGNPGKGSTARQAMRDFLQATTKKQKRGAGKRFARSIAHLSPSLKGSAEREWIRHISRSNPPVDRALLAAWSDATKILGHAPRVGRRR